MTIFFGFLRKTILLALPIVLALGAGWYLRTESDFFVVRDLNIEVEFQENQEAFLVSLKPELEKKLMTLKGQNIWGLGLGHLRAQLLKNPWIKEVELSRRFPDQINSLIRLHSVAFLFLDRQNRIYPILESGEKVPQIKATMAPSAPILRNNKILKDPKLLQKVLELYLAIPQIGPLKKENIESVDYQKVTGLTVKLLKQDVVVYFGDQDIRTKALRVLRVSDYLQSQKQKARVIDASFTKKVLVRPRKRS